MARIPLAEGIAERKDAFLRARFLLVAARATDAGIESEFRDRIEEGHGLRRVAALIGALETDAPAIDRILHRPDDEPLAELCGDPVAELDHLGKIVPRIDMEQRKGKPARPERFFGEPQENRRILAARKQQRGIGEFRYRLAQNEDRLALEIVEMTRLAQPDGAA